MKNCLHAVGFVLACAAGLGGSVQAQDYPAKAITIVVPASPGGSLDVFARAVGEHMSRSLQQPVVVENRPGAEGAIAADYVSKARADGYTLLAGFSTYSVLSHSKRKLPFNFVDDLEPVGMFMSTPFVLASKAGSEGWTDFRSFLAAARTRTPPLRFGSTSAELRVLNARFTHALGFEATEAQYRGGAQMVGDLVGGQIDFGFFGPSVVSGLAKSGKVHLLAVTSRARLKALAQVPTLTELGYPALEVSAWAGLFAPRGTPHRAIQVVADALKQLGANAKYLQLAENAGVEPSIMTGSDFKHYVAQDVERARKAIEQTRLSIE